MHLTATSYRKEGMGGRKEFQIVCSILMAASLYVFFENIYCTFQGERPHAQFILYY